MSEALLQAIDADVEVAGQLGDAQRAGSTLQPSKSRDIWSHMRRDGRLSRTLHALLHMAEAGRPITSDELASRMSTDSAVVRRTMAGLRDAGIVRAEKGHGGGWSLERELAEVTMRDVHEALGITDLFTFGARTESPGCFVEQTVNRAMKRALDVAEKVLLEQLGRVELAAIAAEVAIARRGASPRAPRSKRKARRGK